jgi:radical SAM superfamily enzyme YgiQ (UPF0313 family)
MSPARAVDMIEKLLHDYNPPQIFFFDDLFTIQRKRVIGICQEIVKRNLAFEWSCESRVDTVDYEMLRWMRKAGCIKIYYGLESAAPNVLVTMKKDVTPEKILKGASSRARSASTSSSSSSTASRRHDEAHRETENLVCAARPDAICCSILVPIPGTEVYEEIKHQLVTDVTEQDFHFWHHCEFWKHPRFTHDEIVAARERLIEALTARRPPRWARASTASGSAAASRSAPVLLLDFVEIMRRSAPTIRRAQKRGMHGKTA